MSKKGLLLWLILTTFFCTVFLIYPPNRSAHITMMGVRMSLPVGLSVTSGIIIYYSTRKRKTDKQ
jgi:hypothetical protein